MQEKQIKQYEINFKKYDFVTVIDKGAFGVIHKVQNHKTKVNYAAKIIYVKDKKTKKMINHEIQVMSTIVNPTLIKFHGFSYQKQKVTILMDLMTKGSLEKVLNQTAESLFESGFNNTSRQIILVGISYGMMILHQNNIVHCDLKPGNILIDEKFHPHISDFGSSQFIRNHCEKIQSKVNVTSIYAAPEVFEGEDFDTKADVFSFAMIMYQILTGTRPYPHTDKLSEEFNLLQRISEENCRPDIPESMPKSFGKLLKRCWNKDPKKRPKFEEIFNRLAFNRNCFVFDIFDDENEEEDEDEDSDDVNEQSYYLDEVDTDELFQYIDLITKKSNEEYTSEQNDIIDTLKEQIDDQQKTINSMKKKINKNKESISEQNDIIDRLEKQVVDQQKTINSMKKQINKNKDSISDQNYKIDRQKNKIKKQKLRLNENEEQIKKLIDNKSQNLALQPNSSLPSLTSYKAQKSPLTPIKKIKLPTEGLELSSNKIRKKTEVKERDEESQKKEEKSPRRKIKLPPLSEKSKEEYDEEESHLEKKYYEEEALSEKSNEEEETSEKEYNEEKALLEEPKEESLSEKSNEEEEEAENVEAQEEETINVPIPNAIYQLLQKGDDDEEEYLIDDE